MGRSGYCSGRHVPALHNRGLFRWKGRFAGKASAFCFSAHILIIDYFSPKADGVKMSCIQFLVCGLLCAVPMLIMERPIPTANSGGLDASYLCRRFQLRSGVYASDCGAAAY